MKIYRLDTKKNKWLLYFGLGQIVLAILAQIMAKFTGQSSLLNTISALLDVIWFLTFPAGAFIAGYVSGKLNRPVALWFLFALFLSPIALIILSRKSYYVEPEINLIYRRFELKYLDFIGKCKKLLEKSKLTQQEFDDIKKTKLIELELEMNEAIQCKKTEIYARINKPIEELGDTISPKSNMTRSAYTKCPACETKLNGNEIDCPECELRLK